MRNIYKTAKIDQRGFTLFAAIITAGILVLISFAISAISTREISLSNLNRESGQAIFAANAGIECALFWDTKHVTGTAYDSAFSTSTGGNSINCNNFNITTGTDLNTDFGTSSAVIGGSSMSRFAFSLNSAANPSKACVVVMVNKYYSGSDLKTEISSYGYNNCNISDSRRVERGIFVRY